MNTIPAISLRMSPLLVLLSSLSLGQPVGVLPDAMDGHEIAFHAPTDQVILFGGYNGHQRLNTTWAWTLRGWTLLQPGHAPSHRVNFTLSQCDSSGALLLFGGISRSDALNDSWLWTGTDWIPLAPPESPQPRWGHAAAYDTLRNRIVMFGGYDTNIQRNLNDTWEWDGITWTYIPSPTMPSPRRGHKMAYDPELGCVVLFGGWDGGRDFGDFWAWNGTTWNEIIEPVLPTPRRYLTMTYDRKRSRLVIFGGERGTSTLPDTWERSSKGWYQRWPRFCPPTRRGHAMTHDTRHGMSIVFGGWNREQGLLNDAYFLDARGWNGLPPVPEPECDCAIYRDTSVWEEEWRRSFPAALDRMGLTYRMVGPDLIREGHLLNLGHPRYRSLIVPGGYFHLYQQALGGMTGIGIGDDQLRAFLYAGGNYFGTCAGAFAAADKVVWEGKTYEYHWNLFPGKAIGPRPWNLPPNGPGVDHFAFSLSPESTIFKGTDLPTTCHLLLYGGPTFELNNPSTPPWEYEIHATHRKDGNPAIISFRFPDPEGGLVILSAPHSSIFTDDMGLYDRDPEDLRPYGTTPDPDGNFPDWGVTHALLRATTGQSPTRTPPLPEEGGIIKVSRFAQIGKSLGLILEDPSAIGKYFHLAVSYDVYPGVLIQDDRHLPLCSSPLLLLSLARIAGFEEFGGTLIAEGQAFVTFTVPDLPEITGLVLNFAFVTVDGTAPGGIFHISAPAEVQLVKKS